MAAAAVSDSPEPVVTAGWTGIGRSGWSGPKGRTAVVTKSSLGRNFIVANRTLHVLAPEVQNLGVRVLQGRAQLSGFGLAQIGSQHT